MAKPAGKGAKGDKGEKSSKGSGPKIIKKKAPRASSEDLTDIESDEDLKNKNKSKVVTKAALKNAPKPPSSIMF